MSQQKPPKGKNSLKNIAVLSGIGIEMGVIIYLAAQGGIWLDEHYAMEKKVFTAIATILGVAAAIYVVLLQLKRIKY